MKLKIAFFVTDLNSGGIENYLLRFLRFYEDKISATVYCKAGRKGGLASQFEAIGASVIPLKVGHLGLGDFRKLKRVLGSNRFQAVVDFTGNFAAWPLLAAQRVGVDTRVAFYRSSSLRFSATVLKKLYNRILRGITFRSATNILFNSRTAVSFFYPGKESTDKRIKVIYNGIDASNYVDTIGDLRMELGLSPDNFVVGHVGRFDAAKNHSTLLKVAAKMCAKDPNIRFLFCGKDVPSNLKQSIEELGLTNQVITLDNRGDVSQVLNTLDCFYFPSITEGQPNALLEAIIAGKPFVASDIENIKEIIPLSHHRWLVNALSVNDAVEKISEIQMGVTFEPLSNVFIRQFDHRKWFGQFFKIFSKDPITDGQ
jgi:glycosyltransferase involved in cell wall biosynthesis